MVALNEEGITRSPTSLVWLVIFCEGEEKKKATHPRQHVICRSNVARRGPERKTDNFRPLDPGWHP